MFGKPKARRVKGRVYPTMRDMMVGDSEVFEEDKWNAARSAASWLKKLFGTKFIVHKNLKEPHNIIVRRIE